MHLLLSTRVLLVLQYERSRLGNYPLLINDMSRILWVVEENMRLLH